MPIDESRRRPLDSGPLGGAHSRQKGSLRSGVRFKKGPLKTPPFARFKGVLPSSAGIHVSAVRYRNFVTVTSS